MREKLILKQPDDWHVHLRDTDFLAVTVPHAAKTFARILAMPNLTPPLTQVDAIKQYQTRIEKYNHNKKLKIFFSLYLHDDMSADEIIKAAKTNFILGCKLYPKGATTHSNHGVTDIKKIYPVLKAMEETGLVLQIHGEVTDEKVDIFDREKIFVEKYLAQLIRDFPKLKIALEHVSSQYAVEFIKQAPKNVAATVTVHHLVLTKNDLLAGGLKPYYYCLPIVKTENDREALIKAVTGGDPHFFFGSDSAPHLKYKKEAAVCAAGIYSQYCALEVLTELFEKHKTLDKLENFTSKFGAEFYGLPLNTDTITLEKTSWQMPEYFQVNSEQLIPFKSSATLNWKILD